VVASEDGATLRLWKPQSSIGRWLGLALLIAALAGTVILAWPLLQMLQTPPQMWQIDLFNYAQVVSVLALTLLSGVLSYRVAAAFTLSYGIDRNGLYINWLGNRAVIPLNQITSVDFGIQSTKVPWHPLQGVGYYWGQSQLDTERTLHMFATKPATRSLVIYTYDAAYVISPADQDSFVQELEQRRKLGATQPLIPVVEASRIFLYAFWNDQIVRRLLITAILINLAIMAVLAWRYPGLEELIPMRFNAVGQVAEPRPRHQVLFLPLASFAITLLNIVVGLIFYRQQQIGARLLQGASIIAQILFSIAIITIIR
jgi:hypothetical protein